MKIYILFLLFIFFEDVYSKKIIKTCIKNIGQEFVNSIRSNYKQKLILKNEILKEEDIPTKYKDHKLITISPGGLQGFYTLGVCNFIKEKHNLNNYLYSGASSGAWGALFMCKKEGNNEFVKTIQKIDYEKFSDIFEIEHIIKYELIKNHELDQFDFDKLFIGVTVIDNFQLITHIYSEFDSLIDAIDCCIASSHLPFINGKVLHRYRDRFVFDGGLSTYPYISLENTKLHIDPNMWSKANKYVIDFENLNLKQENINKKLYDLYIEGYNDALENENYISKQLSK